MKKVRLDSFLYKNSFYPSRERAKAAIIEGDVLIDEIPAQKPGRQIQEDFDLNRIRIKKPLYPYVSRGGLKLEKGLEVFDFDVAGKTFIDIGASTGGFTDCLLQNDAAKVYAVDVGYGQLDYSLRENPKVIVLERTNFRHLDTQKIEDKIDGTVMDVSFISITKLLDKISEILEEDSKNIWLIKPQFEAGRESVGKNGVVRNPRIHREVLKKVTRKIQEAGFSILGLDISPIKGPKGNTEFLCFTQKKTPETILGLDKEIDSLIKQVKNE